MVNATMDMKVTVELSDEDRKRIDNLIDLMRTNPRTLPYDYRPAYPHWTPPWQTPVYTRSGAVTSDSPGPFTYNA